MNRINFDLIINELEAGIELAAPWAPEMSFGSTSYFREFRTIGFNASRQIGKTAWMMQRVEDDARSVMVIRDELLLRASIDNHETLVGKPSLIGARAMTIRQLQNLLREDALPLYDTFYIDEAHFCFHFVEKKLFQYLYDKRHFKAKFVLIG